MGWTAKLMVVFTNFKESNYIHFMQIAFFYFSLANIFATSQLDSIPRMDKIS